MVDVSPVEPHAAATNEKTTMAILNRMFSSYDVDGASHSSTKTAWEGTKERICADMGGWLGRCGEGRDDAGEVMVERVGVLHHHEVADS